MLRCEHGAFQGRLAGRCAFLYGLVAGGVAIFPSGLNKSHF